MASQDFFKWEFQYVGFWLMMGNWHNTPTQMKAIFFSATFPDIHHILKGRSAEVII